MLSYCEKVTARWDNPPDYVLALAAACDQSSQHKVSKQTGIAQGAISQLINNCYKANHTQIASRIRSKLHHRIVCSIQGEIKLTTCLETQRRPFQAGNIMRINQYRACRTGCPHYRGD